MRRRVHPGQLMLPFMIPTPTPPHSNREGQVRAEPSPFEQGPVLAALREMNKLLGPIRAPELADYLQRSERTARLYMQRLEQAGMVARPAGPRSGWVAVQ